MAEQQTLNPGWDAVDEASDESFPASDPPAHGGATHAAVEPPAEDPRTRRTWPWFAGAAAVVAVVVVVAIAWRASE